MPKDYVQRILDARVYDVAQKSPLDRAKIMSRRLNNNVSLKREDQQEVFSFKLRGAYNAMVGLSDAQKQRGVIAASAGNHAQGVALAAKNLGIDAIIVMPETTPQIKVDAVLSHGAQVVLVGDSYDDASAHAAQLVAQRGMTYVHPYDDPAVIAGQGTIAVELAQQHLGPIDAIFIPVGGGGLAAGIAAYMKSKHPEVKIIAVEPADAACLKLAMEQQRPAALPEVGIFADGVAVKQIGTETFRVLQHTVDAVLTVSTDEMCAAIKDIFEDTRAIAEPAGALALAGLKNYVAQTGITGKNLIAIVSGANTNFDRLRYISERTEIGERREAVLSVTIPEHPGAFKEFCATIGSRMVTEFNYRYNDAREAHVFVGIQVAPDGKDTQTLIAALLAKGYGVADFTDNEIAKLHIRHMVGGRSEAVSDEKIFRFEFPERPGALMTFLSKLGHNWNISLFHYRNHGAAYGSILVGLEVPDNEQAQLEQFMADLGYIHSDETDNLAYTLFLS